MNLSDYAEQAVLKHCLGIESFPMPTPYVALSTTIAASLETGNMVGEPTGNDYERQPVQFQLIGKIAENTNEIIHTAASDWGILQSVAITDALTGGQVLLWDTLRDIYDNVHTVPVNMNEHKFDTSTIIVSVQESSGSDWLNQRLLKHILGIENFPMPTSHYLAIFKNSEGLQNSEGSWNEITTGDYARQSCSFASNGTLKERVSFPMATAPWDGDAAYLGIMDAENEGHVLFYSEISPQQTVQTGGELYFSEEGISLIVD